MPRNRARTPRNTDKKAFSEEEIADGFAELIPGVDLDSVLADAANKEVTRRIDAAITKKLLAETLVRAFKSREGEIVPAHLRSLMDLVKLDAQIVGNLGEREVRIPTDPAGALEAMAGMSRPQAVLLTVARKLGLTLAPAREEKVIVADPAES